MNRIALPLLAALSGACVIHVDKHTDEDVLTFTEPIEEIRFDLHAGDLDVQVGDVTEVRVERRWTWTGDRPSADAWASGGTLAVELDCPNQTFGTCTVDHVIVVPAGVSIVGETGAGDVSVVGLADAELVTGAGDVFVLDVAGPVGVYTGAGDVELDEIGGDLDVETGSGDVLGRDLFSAWSAFSTGSGDVDLEFEATPERVTVSTGSGDVVVEVPRGTYAVTTHTGVGDVDVTGITTSAGAASRLEVETGSGDVTIYAE